MAQGSQQLCYWVVFRPLAGSPKANWSWVRDQTMGNSKTPMSETEEGARGRAPVHWSPVFPTAISRETEFSSLYIKQ